MYQKHICGKSGIGVLLIILRKLVFVCLTHINRLILISCCWLLKKTLVITTTLINRESGPVDTKGVELGLKDSLFWRREVWEFFQKSSIPFSPPLCMKHLGVFIEILFFASFY